jgi:hypothetical protein
MDTTPYTLAALGEALACVGHGVAVTRGWRADYGQPCPVTAREVEREREASEIMGASRRQWRRLARGGVVPPCQPRTPLGRLARLLGVVTRAVLAGRALAALGDAMACVGHGVAARRATVTRYGMPADASAARILAPALALDPHAATLAWRQAGLDAWREWRTGRATIHAVLAGGWGGGRGLQCSVRALATRPADVATLVAHGVLSADDGAWILAQALLCDDGKIRVPPTVAGAWGVRRGLVDAPAVRDVVPTPRNPRGVVVRWHGIPGDCPHGTPAPSGCPETLAGARREARAGCEARALARYQAQRDDADTAHRKRAKHNAGRGKWHKTGGYSAG